MICSGKVFQLKWGRLMMTNKFKEEKKKILKMAGSLVLILQISVILFFIQPASSLKCYTCNSKEDSRCLDPLDESNGLQLMNCSSDEQQRAQTRKAIEEISDLMAKLGQSGSMSFSNKKASQQWEDEKFPMACQKLELNVEGNEVIGRGCSAPRMENFDPCYAVKLITSKDIVLKSCSLCDTDGCNKGTRNHSNFLYGIITVITFFIMT